MNKIFQWSEAKNQWLKRERDLTFEQVLEAISHSLLDVRKNRSTVHHNQKLFIVDIGNYPWVVPFEETKDTIFLKTAFPDRRLLKEFDYERQ